MEPRNRPLAHSIVGDGSRCLDFGPMNARSPQITLMLSDWNDLPRISTVFAGLGMRVALSVISIQACSLEVPASLLQANAARNPEVSLYVMLKRSTSRYRTSRMLLS